MTMKQNQGETFHDSKSFEEEVDPLCFGSDERYELSETRRGANLAAFDATGRETCCRDEVRGGFPLDIADGSLDFSSKDDGDGLVHQQNSPEKDAYSLSSCKYGKDKVEESLAHETLRSYEKLIYCDRDESINFVSSCDDTSNAPETDPNLCTEIIVAKSAFPESEVSDKMISHEVVKDICIDEGIQNEKNMIGSHKDGASDDPLFTQLPVHKGHDEVKEALPLENPFEKTVENVPNLGSEAKLRSSADIFFKQDTDLHHDPESSEQSGEGNYGKPGCFSSEADALVDRMIRIHQFRKQSSLGSIIFSLDGEEKMPMPPDQIPAASPSEAGELIKDFQVAGLRYNSNVENGSITFNFNSSAHVHVDVDIENAVESENNNRQPIGSWETSSHSTSSNDIVQCTSSIDVDTHDQSHGSTFKSSHGQMSEPKDGVYEDRPPEVEVQSSIIRNQCSSADNTQAVDPKVLKQEVTNSGNASLASLLLHDEGETSFSAVSLVAYSGPIPYSGSISHRSDASTTSGRSFAFPVLQNEWNYSPVRMAKADRRHLRKHKGWRSGLLCCRF